MTPMIVKSGCFAARHNIDGVCTYKFLFKHTDPAGEICFLDELRYEIRLRVRVNLGVLGLRLGF